MDNPEPLGSPPIKSAPCPVTAGNGPTIPALRASLAITPSMNAPAEAFPLPNIDSLPESKLYTESERAHALAIYAETHSSSVVEKQTGIPESTVRSWVASEWGSKAISTIREKIREHAAWPLLTQLLRSHTIIMDRLERGDPVVLHDGTIVRRGVSARDAMMIMAVSQDKWMALTATLETQKNSDQALNSLANKLLEKLAKGQARPAPIIDAKPEPKGDGNQWMG